MELCEFKGWMGFNEPIGPIYKDPRLLLMPKADPEPFIPLGPELPRGCVLPALRGIGGRLGIGGMGGIGGIGARGAMGGRGGTGGSVGKIPIGGIEGIGGSDDIVGKGGSGGRGGTEFIVFNGGILLVMVEPILNPGLLKVRLRLEGVLPTLAAEKVGTFLLPRLSCIEEAVVTIVGVFRLPIVVGKLPLPLRLILVGGPGRLDPTGGISTLPVSKRLRLSSIIFCISFLLLSSSDTLDPLIVPPPRIIPSRASSSVEKTMKASPSSPPTICTPPSGMVNPEKKWRISIVPATMGRPCKRMTTAMLNPINNNHL